MNKEIIIREKKIDWLEIINLALNRTGWGKKHTIYTTGKLTVNAEIATMNFKRNEAEFHVQTNFTYKNLPEEANIEVRYPLNNFKVKDFIRVLKSKLLSELDWKKRVRLRSIAEKKYERFEHKKLTRELAEKYDYLERYLKLDDIKKLSEIAYAAEYEDIEYDVLYEANEKYRDLVNKFVNKTTLDCDDLNNIIKRLQEELKK